MSRLVWLYMYGCWPQVHVDHINRNTSDDRLENLREATRSENLANSKRNKKNTTGFKGVSRVGNIYRSYITRDRKRVWLGNHKTAEAAHLAYLAKAQELYGEFARAE